MTSQTNLYRLYTHVAHNRGRELGARSTNGMAGLAGRALRRSRGGAAGAARGRRTSERRRRRGPKLWGCSRRRGAGTPAPWSHRLVNGDMLPEGSSTATASGRVYGLVSRRRWALALVRSIKYAWMCACYYSRSSLRLYLSGSRSTALWKHFSLKPEKRRNNSRWSFVAVPWTMHASRTVVHLYMELRIKFGILAGVFNGN